MTSLRERLEAKPLQQSIITIQGERFSVVEIDRAERARKFADCTTPKGDRDFVKLEGVMLSRCVSDPEADESVYSEDEWKKWDTLGSSFTGPLMAEVMRLNGMDNQDVGREVKNSDTTTS